MKKWIAGIDIGGTTIKLAFITDDGYIVHKWEIPTDKTDSGIHIVKDIASALAAELNKYGESSEKLLGIGIGAPGPVDDKDGSVIEAVNLGWHNYPLKDMLEKETGLPVQVENDANAAALGEMWKGAGGGSRDLVCVTLGTGVGGGVIANGSIVHGANGAAGEIGHITAVLEDGFPCNCGKTGCLETVASATGMVRVALSGLGMQSSVLADLQAEKGNLTSKDIVTCALEGDAYALEVIDRVSFHLGFTLANLANALNPEKMVIGGGVSRAGDILLKNITKYFQIYTFTAVKQSTEIVLAELGNDAGVIGAAWLIKENPNF